MYLARRAATLGDDQASQNDADLAAINALSSTRLKWEDVFVRSMYLCSDQPCETDWSRFTPRALEQIVQLVVGQSVISGHDRRSLPLARFFKAAVVQRSGGEAGLSSQWVRAWFYWLRETSGATDLLLNIDGGIYREVSIAWRYRHWKCSICGQEDGICHHRPGELVGNERCLRIIDEVLDVLEGSLVYKGADAGAILTRSVAMASPTEDQAILCIWDEENDLFRLLVDQHLLTDVAEVTPEGVSALRESATQIWLDDFQPIVRSGCDPRQLLAPGGCLLTRETDGSIQPYLVAGHGILVYCETEEDGSRVLVAQRPE